MTFPLAEDIIVQSWGGIIVYLDDEKKAEVLKQQILSEHEIVERLKEEIIHVITALNHLDKNYQYDREEQKQMDWILLKTLKSILENKK